MRFTPGRITLIADVSDFSCAFTQDGLGCTFCFDDFIESSVFVCGFIIIEPSGAVDITFIVDAFSGMRVGGAGEVGFGDVKLRLVTAISRATFFDTADIVGFAVDVVCALDESDFPLLHIADCYTCWVKVVTLGFGIACIYDFVVASSHGGKDFANASIVVVSVFVSCFVGAYFSGEKPLSIVFVVSDLSIRAVIGFCFTEKEIAFCAIFISFGSNANCVVALADAGDEFPFLTVWENSFFSLSDDGFISFSLAHAPCFSLLPPCMAEGAVPCRFFTDTEALSF